MRSKIREMLSRDHTIYDCFACAILSHGRRGEIFGTDSDTLRVEDLIDDLTHNRNPTLVGKPKLFFIQACRGNEKNVGISAQTAGGAGKTSAQKAGNAEKTRAQEAGDAGKTSAQEAGDAGKTSAQEAGDAGEMSAQEVDDAGETSAQEAGDAGETSAQEAGDAGETSAQKAGDAGEMSAQEVGDSGELPVLVEFKTTEKIHITSTRGNEQFDSEIVPSGADILIAEATLPGFLTIRNTLSGTWFMQALAYVFANYAHMLDITELLLAVGSVVSKAETARGRYKMMPAHIAALSKKLFFFPGLHRPR
nr:hypothetical protein BaRGS_003712 [Batillaria attramentaria]